LLSVVYSFHVLILLSHLSNSKLQGQNGILNNMENVEKIYSSTKFVSFNSPAVISFKNWIQLQLPLAASAKSIISLWKKFIPAPFSILNKLLIFPQSRITIQWQKPKHICMFNGIIKELVNLITTSCFSFFLLLFSLSF
jgi:hypothetical protein